MNAVLTRSSLWLGAISGGLMWGALEVFWLEFKVRLLSPMLSRQLSLPPPDLLETLIIAGITYTILGGIILIASSFIQKRLFNTTQENTALFLIGMRQVFAVLAVGGLVVWVIMLAKQPLWAPPVLMTCISLVITVLMAIQVLYLALMRLAPTATSLLVLTLLLTWGLAGTTLYMSDARKASPLNRPVFFAPDSKLQNILFVTIDSLRHDVIMDGAPIRASTPIIDQLQAQGVLFEQAISQAPNTRLSHSSIFTSRYPFQLRPHLALPVDVDTENIPLILSQYGYQTAAIISGHTTKSHIIGIGSWFQHYADSLVAWSQFFGIDSLESLVPYRIVERILGKELDARTVNRRAQEWLARRSSAPFFLWVQYYEGHGPHIPPNGGDIDSVLERYPDVMPKFARYIKEIEYVDRELGKLLEILASEDALESTLIIIASDHGEAFNEPHPHIDSGHGKLLYDSVLRVPLIFTGAGIERSGGKVSSQVENIDIAPTILNLIGIQVPSGFKGKSLLPEIIGKSSIYKQIAFSQTSSLVEPRWFSIRSTTDKLLVSPDIPAEELFDLNTDPGERINIIKNNLDKVKQYRIQLIEYLQLNDNSVTGRFLKREEKQGFVDLNYIGKSEKH